MPIEAQDRRDQLGRDLRSPPRRLTPSALADCRSGSGFIGDVLAGGPSRAGEEIVVNLGLSGLLRAGGAGSAAFGTFLAEEEGATVLIPGSRKLYPNQLPERLAEEVAAAERVGATAIEPGTPAFVDATDQGLIKFVVTADEKLLVSPYTVGGEEISHAVLSGGEPVLTGGQADIASGGGQFFGIDIVEHSGHFLPSAESLDIARALFARYGITFP